MTYSALDNLEAAKHFREQMILEKQDLEATLSYEAHLASRDSDEDWEPNRFDQIHQNNMDNLIKSLSKYIDGLNEDAKQP